MAGSADDSNVMAEVLAAKLGADSCVPAHGEQGVFKFEVAEAMTALASGGGERIEVSGRGEFCSFHGERASS